VPPEIAATSRSSICMLDEKNRDDVADAEQEDEGEQSPDVVTSRRRQAAMIARRISQMVGAETGRAEFQIYDKEEKRLRDVDYRDIVVLMRSPAKRANDYVEVLRLAGVPVSCEATAGYFEATEISDMLCLLKILDNPQRDIELAAVLRSPFFNVADTGMAKIKLHGKKNSNHKSFYNSVVEYSKSGGDAGLAERIAQVLAQIEHWRTTARRGSIADMIWRIYRSTNYLSFVSALPSGQARRANLLKLHDRAIQFEGFVASCGIPSLRRFVEFIEKLQQRGQDWSPAEPTACAGNAVRILSVHKSKGLEFPVVFLAELESRFNKKDIYADCLADAEDTLGLQIIDRKSNSKLRSLAHEVVAETRLATMLAEEMRILYVATTRARERLILTASQKRKTCTEIVTNGFYFGEGPLPAWLLGACQNPVDWILYGFSDRKALHEAFQTGLAGECRDDNLFSFKFHDQAELRDLSQFVINLKDETLRRRPDTPQRTRGTQDDGRRTTEDSRTKGTREIINNQLSIINESLAWRYRFGDTPLLPAKTSVSELTHRNDEYVRLDYSKAIDRRPASLAALEPGRGRTPDSRLLGSATHLVIAALDLRRPVTADAIGTAIEKLAADGALSATVAAQIDGDSILTFFQGDLGRLALDAENRVHREWPFTFALPASEWHNPSDARQTMNDGGQTTGGSLKRSAPPESVEGLGMANDASRFTLQEIRDMPGGSLKRSLGMVPTEGDTPSRNTQYAIRDTIIVQGIIDMLIQTPQGLVVIDFKTDNISPSQAPQRAELYRGQLDLYAKAASSILKTPTVGKSLYFLAPRRAVEIR